MSVLIWNHYDEAERKKKDLIFGSGEEINEVVLFISISVKKHLTLLATSLKRDS